MVRQLLNQLELNWGWAELVSWNHQLNSAFIHFFSLYPHDVFQKNSRICLLRVFLVYIFISVFVCATEYFNQFVLRSLLLFSCKDHTSLSGSSMIRPSLNYDMTCGLGCWSFSFITLSTSNCLRKLLWCNTLNMKEFLDSFTLKINCFIINLSAIMNTSVWILLHFLFPSTGIMIISLEISSSAWDSLEQPVHIKWYYIFLLLTLPYKCLQMSLQHFCPCVMYYVFPVSHYSIYWRDKYYVLCFIPL